MIDQQRFRDLMAGVCAPVTVVTTMHGGVPHGATVSSLASLSLDPPATAAIAPWPSTRRTGGRRREADRTASPSEPSVADMTVLPWGQAGAGMAPWSPRGRSKPAHIEVVILGGGYAVGLLQPLAWLADLDVVYWGDIDTHGFAILDRLRRRFPHVTSMLMDMATLLAHPSQWVTEAAPTSIALDNLAPPELSLYRSLADGEFGSGVRLEQERVSFAAIARAVAAAGQ